jgi:hypothetical protein
MVQQSHRHHYVPKWYQRRFLAPGQTSFKILDLSPPKFTRRDGTFTYGRQILDKGPSAFFLEHDLYTTRFFGAPNDEIERMLFGVIDRAGQIAIDAFIGQEWETVHNTYWDMYEFMDALRLRTPKGLLFVRTVSKAKTYNDLLYWMQLFRRMLCVMWAEGVLEIVSAEDSPLKFIFSDHPVTLFNRFVFRGDPKIPQGMDPLVEWMGTQTLFPFDQNRLFVLTHLEWARSPGPLKARKSRTNARYFDNTHVNYTLCIRNRKLTVDQVREVNYIIKARAYRYIAGRTEDDLFPERHLHTTMWNKLGLFLMPHKDEIAEFGGQIYASMKDGTYFYQDEFGRRPKTKEEYEQRAEEAKQLERDVREALEKSRDRINDSLKSKR